MRWIVVYEQKDFFILIFILMVPTPWCCALIKCARDKGFVYLHEIDPTIQVSMRYGSVENFVGRVIDGYKRPVAILTKQAATALAKVQQEVQKDGYSLVVYDAYRPQKAVRHFMRWAGDNADQTKKHQYYGRVDKQHVFELGYVAKRSAHSRGSTVDITLIKKDKSVHAIVSFERTLRDGHKILVLDDGTVDMGSSFDLFDQASHYENNLLPNDQKKMRVYLKTVMEKHGFVGCSQEWWHFTLRHEPFAQDNPHSYFDFDVS